METKKQLFYKVIQYFLGIIVFLFILPALVFSCKEIFYLIQINTGQPFYVDRQYSLGFIGLIFCLAMITIVIYAVLRPRYLALLCIPFILMIHIYIGIPSFIKADHVSRVNIIITHPLNKALSTCLKKRSHLPKNQSELILALEEYGDSNLNFSPYFYNNEQLPFIYKYVKNASGPYLPQPPAPFPGVIYCAISEDLKSFWLTATVLEKPVGNKVVLLKNYSSSRIEVVRKTKNNS